MHTVVRMSPRATARTPCVTTPRGAQATRKRRRSSTRSGSRGVPDVDGEGRADGQLSACPPDSNGRPVRPLREESLGGATKAGRSQTQHGQVLRLGARGAPQTCLQRRYRSDKLTADVIAQWERKLADKIEAGAITAKTFNHIVALLSVILNWARKGAQRYLSHDPLVDVARLRIPKIERRFLKPDEIDALLAAAAPPVDMVIYLAVYSGLRRGELFGLEWGDLDEKAGTLRIVRNNYQCEIVTPKTSHSVRTVDIMPSTVRRLLDYKAQFPSTPTKKRRLYFSQRIRHTHRPRQLVHHGVCADGYSGRTAVCCRDR